MNLDTKKNLIIANVFFLFLMAAYILLHMGPFNVVVFLIGWILLNISTLVIKQLKRAYPQQREGPFFLYFRPVSDVIYSYAKIKVLISNFDIFSGRKNGGSMAEEHVYTINEIIKEAGIARSTFDKFAEGNNLRPIKIEKRGKKFFSRKDKELVVKHYQIGKGKEEKEKIGRAHV